VVSSADADSSNASTLRRRVATAWPLLAVAALSLIWTPILGRGFSSDDFGRVPTTWLDFVSRPFSMDGRPLEMLSFALLPKDALVHHATSLLAYGACIGLMWRFCRRMALGPWSTFLALSSFFHPAFLWAVTWIAQRSTLLFILFLLASIVARRTVARVAMIVTGSAARTPYVLQNVVFAFHFLRRGQLAASVISIVCTLVFSLAGYLTYYDRAAGTDTLANPSIPTALSLPLRIAKVLEGVLYVFAPVPMFAVSSWAPVLALIGYAICWLIIARSLQPIRTDDDVSIAALAVAMCIPFMFASEVRVTGEAVVVVFLAVACAAKWRLSGKIAAVGILTLNLSAIALNYGVFASQQRDIHGAPVLIDASQPVYAYREWREDLRRRVLSAVGVSVPRRTLE
jgi:hypothetical protein